LAGWQASRIGISCAALSAPLSVFRFWQVERSQRTVDAHRSIFPEERAMKGLPAMSLLCVGILSSSTNAVAAELDANAIREAASNGADTLLTGDEISRVVTGFRIAPVSLNLRGKNVVLVGLGSYLVNAGGGCNDCHTHPAFAPGGDPFRGEPEVLNASVYLSGGRMFGPITSKNITPDENGQPAGLTFAEFENLLRTGRDDDNPSRILQVMPWNIYGKLTTRDLRAIYEYLTAIPPLPNNPNPGP